MINLSIIIPHYNTPIKLKRLLDSIPMRNDLEVIVVDDRSNKDLEVLDHIKEEFKTDNIFFFENNRINKGAGTCRNIGMEHAKGQWFLFADADDYFMEGFLDKVKLYFETNNDIVFFNPTSWDEVNKKISNRHINYSNLVKNYLDDKSHAYNELYLRYRFVVPWSKLINAKFIKEKAIKFDEVIASNDEMFSIKAGSNARVIEVSKQIIYCVTKDKGTLTQNISIPVFRARLETGSHKYTYIKSKLSKKDFEALELRSIGYLVSVIKYRLGLKELVRTYRFLKDHRFRLVNKSLLNPWMILRKISFHIHDLFKSKSFKTKN